MSKQLRLKFKRILREAEFVQADLTYHEEMFPDAKKEFGDELTRIIQGLSEEDKKRIEAADAKRLEALQREIEKRRNETQEEDDEEELPEQESNEDTTLEKMDIEPEDVPPGPKQKVAELKKMFYRIAEHTHPDKLASKGYSAAEIQKRSELFKRAKEAYEKENWYQLYSLGLGLGVPLPDPSEENFEWVQGDIENIKSRIAHIASMIAWIWYTGDDNTKFQALWAHFKQLYDLDLVVDPDS